LFLGQLGGGMAAQEKHKIGTHGSWWALERNIWNYGWGSFNEVGYLIHISKEDIDFYGAQLSAAMTAMGAIIAATGGSFVLPGIGTVSGGLVGGAVGAALGQLAAIVGTVAMWFARNADGSFDARVAPHGLQIGESPAFDPNTVPLVWDGVRRELEKLNRPSRRLRAIEAESEGLADRPAFYGGTIEDSELIPGSEIEPPDDPDRIAAEAVRSMPGKRSEAGTEAAKANRSGAKPGGQTKKAAETRQGSTEEGKLALGKAAYYRIELEEGAEVEFTIYTRLEADSYPVEGSFAICDEEGGVLDSTILVIDASGDDYSREKVSYEAEESGPHLIRIRADSSMSDRAPISFKIKTK